MRSLNGSHWPANMRSTRIVFQKANLTVKPANYTGRPQDARIVSESPTIRSLSAGPRATKRRRLMSSAL
jgi:hypothetical protein